MKEGGKGREERRGERGGQGSFSNRNVSKKGSYFAKFPGGTQAGGRSYPRTPSLSGPRHQSCGPRHAEGPLTPVRVLVNEPRNQLQLAAFAN